MSLCRHLGLDPATFGDLDPSFPMLAPRPFVDRMRRGDASDPLLRQVLPRVDESRVAPGFERDPVADRAAAIAPGVLKKYRGRVLMVASGACAIHCRYCFRRHFPYSETPSGLTAWEESIRAIEADPSISEIILSGGDPLSVIDRPLAALVRRLEAIPHLRRLRVHSRLPVLIPARVTPALIELFRASRVPVVLVLHVNHPNEIDAEVVDALRRLSSAGVTLLNQSVLLDGVNDEVDVLERLATRLFEAGVLPYYLHQFDRVVGAHDYEVDRDRGRRLVAELRARLPGYLVPRYVADQGESTGKTLLV